MFAPLLSALAACERPESPPVETEVPPPPIRCGDGVLAESEACDDGNALGGDGCLPDCTPEPGPLESEPNDAWDAADPFTATVYGGLPEGDVDCFTFEVPACESISATLGCPADGLLALHDPSGVVVATGSLAAGGCPALDPETSPGARFAAAGPHAICVSSLTGAVIPAYTLDVSVGDAGPFSFGPADDPDADGLPASCDADDDGDGVIDTDDNCPDVSNGPQSPSLAPAADGFLGAWLALGPITGTKSPNACLPSLDELPGGDASLAPELGDTAAGLAWTASLTNGAVIDFLPEWGTVYAPREIYLHTYVYAAVVRPLTLAVGADDGVRAWLEGAVVLDVESCQGVNLDQFQAPVALLPGWNRLTLEVRDQGGGWGMSVRFLDGGSPVTDLELSLSADPDWSPSQADQDGDGEGDLCDPTPLGG